MPTSAFSSRSIFAILPTVRFTPQSIAFRPPPLTPPSQRDGSTTITVLPASATPRAAATPQTVSPCTHTSAPADAAECAMRPALCGELCGDHPAENGARNNAW